MGEERGMPKSESRTIHHLRKEILEPDCTILPASFIRSFAAFQCSRGFSTLCRGLPSRPEPEVRHAILAAHCSSGSSPAGCTGCSRGRPAEYPGVNDAPSGTLQENPATAVDEDGTIFIAWSGKRSGNSPGIYRSRSTDGGSSWSENIRASSSADPGHENGTGAGNRRIRRNLPQPG